MDMLLLVTGQHLHGFLHRLKAGVGVLMFQHLQLAADQTAGFIIAVRCMLMGNNFLFPANKFRFCRLLIRRLGGQRAGQNIVPAITLVGVLVARRFLPAANQYAVFFIAFPGVLVARILFLFTDQNTVLVIAAFLMLVARILFLPADQGFFFPIAVCRVRMTFAFLLPADQFSAFQRVTVLRMGMGLLRGRPLLCIAAVGMLMGFHLRQRAAEVAILVIAGRIMLMYHKVRITADQGPVPVITLGSMLVNPQGVQIAVQHLFGDRGLGIARPGMGMFRNFTGGSFQRDGRQDQGVGGAKDHHRRQTGDNPIPPLFALVLAGILCRLLLVLLHFRHRPFCIGTGIPKRPRTAQTFFVVVEFVPPRQGG